MDDNAKIYTVDCVECGEPHIVVYEILEDGEIEIIVTALGCSHKVDYIKRLHEAAEDDPVGVIGLDPSYDIWQHKADQL